MLSLLAPPAIEAAVPDTLRDRLQRAVELPRVELTAGFSFNAESLTAEEDVPDAAAAAKKLRAQLTGEPSDASKLLRLGQLARLQQDSDTARKVLEQSVGLFRKRLQQQPGEVSARIGLAEALAEQDQLAEAERLLRDLVRDSASESGAWMALGRVLERRASKLLAPFVQPAKGSPARLTPEVLERSKRFWDEARRSFDQAVTTAPKDYRPLAQRARHISNGASRTLLLESLMGRELDPAEFGFASFTSNALPDLVASSALAPRDYRLHAAVVFYTVLSYWNHARAGRDSNDWIWEGLPAEIRDSTRRHMQALETLGEDGDPKIASGALENLALIKLALMRETNAGTAAIAKRAVRLDPARSQAWELVLAALTSSERFEELQTTLEDRLRVRPDPRSVFMLAKVLARKERWEESEQRMLQGIEATPNNALLRLGYASLLVRRGDNDVALDTARSELEAVTKLLANIKDPGEHAALALHTGVTSAIVFAMEGDVDEARKFLKLVKAADRDSEYLRKVLELLGD
jgi:tetratricopeptide (TPR) repeat protein